MPGRGPPPGGSSVNRQSSTVRLNLLFAFPRQDVSTECEGQILASDHGFPMRTHTLQPDLTPRQLEILFTLMQGASNRDIATRLGVSEQTVKNQLTVMYEKMGVQNRLQLALEGLRFARKAS